MTKAPSHPSLWDRMMSRGVEERRRTALEKVDHILQEAKAEGFDVVLFGSLARNDFMAHSDIDLLARGDVPPNRMAVLERIVSRHLKNTDLPYDLVFESAIGPENTRRLLNG